MDGSMPRSNTSYIEVMCSVTQSQLERMKTATELAAVVKAQLAPASPSGERNAQRGSHTAAQGLPSLQRGSAPATTQPRRQAAAEEPPPPPQALRVPPGMRPSRVRGLSSSLALEEGLRSHWYPAHFASVSCSSPMRALPKPSVSSFTWGNTGSKMHGKPGHFAATESLSGICSCPKSLGRLQQA